MRELLAAHTKWRCLCSRNEASQHRSNQRRNKPEANCQANERGNLSFLSFGLFRFSALLALRDSDCNTPFAGGGVFNFSNDKPGWSLVGWEAGKVLFRSVALGEARWLGGRMRKLFSAQCTVHFSNGNRCFPPGNQCPPKRKPLSRFACFPPVPISQATVKATKAEQKNSTDDHSHALESHLHKRFANSSN